MRKKEIIQILKSELQHERAKNEQLLVLLGNYDGMNERFVGNCGECGNPLTVVRPGKSQCDWCSEDGEIWHEKLRAENANLQRNLDKLIKDIGTMNDKCVKIRRGLEKDNARLREALEGAEHDYAELLKERADYVAENKRHEEALEHIELIEYPDKEILIAEMRSIAREALKGEDGKENKQS
jgi:hypothetical protein